MQIPKQSHAALDREGMVFVAGGTFLMGSDRHYPEEAPAHRARVDGFWIDRTPVTNAQFAAFVAAARYVTVAERPLNPAKYPGVPLHLLKPGSLVFSAPAHAVDPSDWVKWWTLVFGASWRRPYGPPASYRAFGDHPVVHISFEDALAYATWPGRTCPRRRNGSSPRVAAWRMPITPGATHSCRTAAPWRTPGTASFLTKIPCWTVSNGLRRSRAFRRMGMGYST